MIKVLDLFCGVGGASEGYKLAGATEIVGVDIMPQPNYPYTFIQADAIEYLQQTDLSQFDFIHASPPCLAHTLANVAAKKQGKVYDDFIDQTRYLLIASKKPYCIENVINAKLKTTVRLQGAMFGLPIIRKRDFECNFFIMQPPYINQKNDVRKGRCVTVAGQGYKKGSPYKGKLKIMPNLTILGTRKIAMGINWAKTLQELNNAIPPIYTQYILWQYRLNQI